LDCWHTLISSADLVHGWTHWHLSSSYWPGIYFHYGALYGLPYMIPGHPILVHFLSPNPPQSTSLFTTNMEEVYVFGDQTADCRAFFTKVFPRKDDVLLQSFLERASEAVRIENKNRSHPSKAVPNFGTIQELVDRYYRSETKDAAVESALVCISQFAHFIG
jgi:Starter unit:ACP transacylase in aflatoxin biosynthesis